MKLLLYSGLLYLAGVAVILILQPTLMFTEEGIWKEFGIGRNQQTHTWMPFWLFAIIWAILSYIIVLLLAGHGGLPGVKPDTVATAAAAAEEAPLSYKNFQPMAQSKGRGKRSNSLIPGYYILNREATEMAGTPKYVYLGPEPPSGGGVDRVDLTDGVGS